VSDHKEGVSLAVLAGVVFVSTVSALVLYNVVYNTWFAEEESCLQLPGPASEAPVPPPLPKR
jgi:hypothetical protein